jgi:hypothetical protein
VASPHIYSSLLIIAANPHIYSLGINAKINFCIYSSLLIIAANPHIYSLGINAKINFCIYSSLLIMEINFQKNFAIFLITGIFCVFGVFGVSDNVEAGASDNVSGWAWSDNIGWICFNSVTDGSAFNYGVDIDDTTGEFSGYAWSDNVGWISFEPGDVAGCPVAGICEAMLDKETGEVSGWAKVISSDSWIRLSDRTNGFVNDDVYVDKITKEFHNYAWSDDYGWISFNCKEGGPGGVDICGTSDFQIHLTTLALNQEYQRFLGKHRTRRLIMN